MCSIAGYKLLKKPNRPKVAEFIERLLLEGQVRGKHATGIAYLEPDQSMRVRRSPIPAGTFVQSSIWKYLKEHLPESMLLHTRYSTSGDWTQGKNNQPLYTNTVAMVHNGLVSQASVEEMENLYACKMNTDNDSEVLLQHIAGRLDKPVPVAISNALWQLHKVHPPIFACGFLDTEGNVYAVRDHIRPLWFFLIPAWGVVGFASTQDIIARAAAACGSPEIVTWEAEPYTVYTVGTKINTTSVKLPFDYPTEVRFARPTLVNQEAVAADNKRVTQNGKYLDISSDADKTGDGRVDMRESFLRYSAAAVGTWEIDPNYALLNYLFQRFELSKSQEYWVCWLYGVFYHPGTVWYVFQEFPEFEKVDLERLKKWHATNWKHLRYNTDMKYNKGHFVAMFESYRDMIGSQRPEAQHEFFSKLLTSKNRVKNFHAVWKAVINLYKFGRYTAYIYTEALHRCMGMPIKADSMFLKEAKSSRAGLCYAIGKPEWAHRPVLTSAEWDVLFYESESLMKELRSRWPDLGVDPWLMESCFCAWKGFFRSNKGRYLGYYYDRMADEILQMQHCDVTSGVDFKPLWDFRKECVPWEYCGEYAKPPRLQVQKSWEHVFKTTGRIVGLWPAIQRKIVPNTQVTHETSC